MCNTQVVQADIDRGNTGFLLGTPALARELDPCCQTGTYDGIQIGIPLGIAVGRLCWKLFAHQLAAVLDPVIPAIPSPHFRAAMPRTRRQHWS